MDLVPCIATELGLPLAGVAGTVALLEEGATVPFIARYRKERTHGFDEEAILRIEERLGYLRELEERRAAILKSIAGQGKLNADLETAIKTCRERTALEDLYLPYRPKRRTRASMARDRGLEPLLLTILERADSLRDLPAAARSYVSPEREVADEEAALAGAADIFAENLSEEQGVRAALRAILLRNGWFCTRATKETKKKNEATKFENYYEFRTKISALASHNLLAMLRGEREGVLGFEVELDDSLGLPEVVRALPQRCSPEVRAFLTGAAEDGYRRLLLPSLANEVKSERQRWAELEAIEVFATNLRELLLAPPVGPERIVALDPGFRTGCKVVALDEQGKLLEHLTIFPNEPRCDVPGAERAIQDLCERQRPRYLAVGNGTAGRETVTFLRDWLVKKVEKGRPEVVSVNESGASVYSASEVARREMPDLDLTVRGAVSIGRRLRDPLAELVKIDPKAIGVGQYQHDVEQKLLRQRLEQVVVSCVSNVGVDVNSASAELLAYVSGLNKTVAANIIAHRDAHGPFPSREALRAVPRLGERTFEQAAGFLRVRDGGEPLDTTGIHPESYPLVRAIAEACTMPVKALLRNRDVLTSLDPARFVTERFGLPTLTDILEELQRPGRDPRPPFVAAAFRDDIRVLSDLHPGLLLPGIVTNVTKFGAFVDLGVHQDGLVHISELADRYVRDPAEVVRPGQGVTVRVLEVDVERRRIALSLRQQERPVAPSRLPPAPAKTEPRPEGPSADRLPTDKGAPGRPTPRDLQSLAERFGKPRNKG